MLRYSKRPGYNLHLNWKLNLNLGFLVCYLEATEANDAILIAPPGRLDKAPSKEKKMHAVGLLKIKQNVPHIGRSSLLIYPKSFVVSKYVSH